MSRKCQLFPHSINYLGHAISQGNIAPDRTKLIKIEQWPFPSTGLEVLSFLGLRNYYRKSILEFADLADALYKVAGAARVEPNEELMRCFTELKNKLCNAGVLRLPKPQCLFILETDASLIAVGAVLKQIENDEEFTVLFYSHALSSSQRNYSTYERELFAVVRACEAFRVFLLGKEFVIRTDHRALMGIFSFPLQTSNRVVKWVMRLQPYKFKIEIVK